MILNGGDYCSLSEQIESAWINQSEQIIFNKEVYKISNIYYSELQCERILFIEDSEQKDAVIYFEMMTQSKINYFKKTIQGNQESLNNIFLYYSYKAYVD